MTKARELGKLVSQGQPLADGIQAADVSGLATVATSGSYTDLTNKPSGLGGGPTSYNDLTNKPNFATVATSGSYTDLTNKPTIPTVPELATVATSGSYTDLTNKPTLFNGSYTDLTSKPTLFSGSYSDLTNKPTLFSGSYTDLTGKPTLFSGSYSDLTNKPTLATVATTGSYTDLSNKPVVISLKGTAVTYPGDDLAADPAGAQTITITGTGFESTPTVYIGGTIAPSVTFVSSTQLSVTTPAKAAGTYDIYIVNPGGATAIMVYGISYSGTPAWTTAAGNLGSVGASFTVQLQASGDAPVTYALTSGSTLPSGVTLSSTGLITGTALSTEQTFNFSVDAIDAQRQQTPRSFQVTIALGDAYFKYVTLLLSGDGTNAAQNNTFLDSSTSTATSSVPVPSGVLDPTTATNGWFVRTGSTQSDYTISPREYVVRANGVTVYTSTSSFPTSVSYGGITYTPGTYVDSAYGWSGDYINRFGINASSAVFPITISRNGNTTQGSFSPYGSNWSNYFNGASYLQTSTTQVIPTGSFTVECLAYLTSTTNQGIVSQGTTGSANRFSISVDGGLWWVQIGNSIINTGVPATNVWLYLAATFNGTTLSFYVNNTLIGSVATTNSAEATTFAVGSLGSGWAAGSYYTTGYISNVRVSNIVRTIATPTVAYTSDANTRLLACQSNSFVDKSSNAFAITVTGTPTIQRFSPFSPTTAYSTSVIGGSGYFDGSGDYLSIGNQTALHLGASDFSIECWTYLTSTSGAQRPISQNDTNYEFAFYIANGGGVTAYSFQSSGTQNFGISGGTLITGQWYHLACTRTGTTVAFFVNGVRQGTATFSGTISTSTSGWDIGAIGAGTDPQKGYVTDARIVIGSNPYGVGTTLTLPTAPLTAITNTQLLCNFTNAGILDNAMINDLETVGNAQISTSVKKYGTGSMQFDTGNYLTLKNTPISTINGKEDFTVEGWIYPTAFGAYNCIYSSGFPFQLYVNSNTVGFWSSSSTSGSYDITTALYGPSNSVVLNTWTHFAIVRNGSTFTMYINGVAGTPTTSTGSIAIPTEAFSAIGTYPASPTSYPFVGYIDDFRITKGYARYTSNFTPPATAHKQK